MAIGTIINECNGSSPNLISPNIKRENNDQAKREDSSPKQQNSKPAITFSIENILSNNFGKTQKRRRESDDITVTETPAAKIIAKEESSPQMFPAWIYCTRYSDRPSSGPRYRKPKTPKAKSDNDEKRPRTAFSAEQLARLKREFNENNYLNERRRHQLSSELGLNEAQIKIWFQNKRAKIKKTTGQKNPLAMQLMAQGLYNHSTVALTKEEEELEMRMNGQL